MKYVSQTKAGSSITAILIMKGSKVVARINAHYADSGVVTVDCWNWGKSSNDEMEVQQGKASGGGYDKFVAAIKGMEIDGHLLSDHCGEQKKTPKSGKFADDFKCPKGWHMANGRQSCYRMAGLEYLRDKGYQVHQAI